MKYIYLWFEGVGSVGSVGSGKCGECGSVGVWEWGTHIHPVSFTTLIGNLLYIL
ncbi:MAG: hypothetical protein WBA93_01265 [Microcoleaceae cyanobacterium]